MPAPITVEAFWSRAVRSACGCLEWTGSLNKDGYGHLGYRRKYWLAHRLAWKLHHSQEIPVGACVCHSCDNPKCIDPAHLFLGSQAENMSDMRAKGRRKEINAGSENGRAKLSDDSVREIRRAYKNNELNQVALAEKFSVSQTVISLIVTRKTWKMVD